MDPATSSEILSLNKMATPLLEVLQKLQELVRAQTEGVEHLPEVDIYYISIYAADRTFGNTRA
jgi:hypothetical protein